MKELIYKTIQEKIEQCIPEIKHINLWNNNTDHLEKERAFNTPALFIEFEPIEWTSKGRNVSTYIEAAIVKINIYILLSDLASASDKRYCQQAMDTLTFSSKIVAALSGLSNHNSNCQFNSLIHKNDITDHNHDKLLLPTESFTTYVVRTLKINNMTTTKDVNLQIQTKETPI